MAGSDVRFGGFVGAADVADETVLTFGGEVQKYLANATLTGSLAYTTADDIDVDAWTVGGDAAFYVGENLRLASAGMSLVAWAKGSVGAVCARTGRGAVRTAVSTAAEAATRRG